MSVIGGGFMGKVVLSIDYDGCGAILINSGKVVGDKYHEQLKKRRMNPDGLDNIIFSCYKLFMDKLDEITEGMEVDLYVGSNRQSKELNFHNMKSQKNGDCFKNYQELATQKGWTFRKKLLADIMNAEGDFYAPLRQNSGEAMDIALDDSSTDTRLDKTIFDRTKVQIIKCQLESVGKHHPDEPVDFYFFDDDAKNKILPALKQYFTENPQDIPSNVTLHLVKSDYFPALEMLCRMPGDLRKDSSKVTEAFETEPLLADKLYKEYSVFPRLDISQASPDEETCDAPISLT